MLVCPNCEAENPTRHKFCQQCGASLETYWALLVYEGDRESLEKITAQLQDVTQEVALRLDEQSRYRLHSSDREFFTVVLESAIAPLDPETEDRVKGTFKARVWDALPTQTPFLEVLLEQQDEAIAAIEASEDLSQLSASSDFWQQIGVPDLALPYLILQEVHAPIVPAIRDAWQYEGWRVVILEDRSHWPLLRDMWSDPDLPLLQILCWLDEMARLWEDLASANVCRSLLDMNNLHVDEDQSLCIQQLYGDPDSNAPSLQDLGLLWQQLFSASDRTLYGPLAQFLVEVSQGKIDDLEELRSQLQTLARLEDEGESPVITNEEAAAEPMYLGAEDETIVRRAPESRTSPQAQSDDMPTVVLPMQIMSLHDAGYTDIGHQRDHNEDNFGIEIATQKQENVLGRTLKARGLYVVCDGMGGHAAGEVASALAVESLQDYFREHWPEGDRLPDRETIHQGILTANQKIYEVNQDNDRSGVGRMGTTLVMALVANTHVAIAHVGDSRIYSVTRKRGLEQLTTDHEVGQREIQRGVEPEDAYARPDAYQLTQALGPRNSDFIQPDISFFDINEDMLMLLCSDGLSDGGLLENQYQKFLTPLISSKANVEQGLIELVEFANQYNGHDNITGVLVRLKVRPSTERGF
ncbi:MAG: serine/threonine phosphatase [Jaaginema sp. PMC 1079.18]|nr:serine/threonine phosphatase [Jaaginema sp. PMC 1079.18]